MFRYISCKYIGKYVNHKIKNVPGGRVVRAGEEVIQTGKGSAKAGQDF